MYLFLHDDNMLCLRIMPTCSHGATTLCGGNTNNIARRRYRLPGELIVVFVHIAAGHASVAVIDLWSVAAPRDLARRRKTQLGGQTELGVVRSALAAAAGHTAAAAACTRALGVALTQPPADVKAVNSLVRLGALCSSGAS